MFTAKFTPPENSIRYLILKDGKVLEANFKKVSKGEGEQILSKITRLKNANSYYESCTCV